ncbi:hypothetical protein AX16_004590 [Volvariella volvacea WC 439]|nr:hypothetical protein AX16_004590 [Volvariella volvacea WC 439]
MNKASILQSRVSKFLGFSVKFVINFLIQQLFQAYDEESLITPPGFQVIHSGIWGELSIGSDLMEEHESTNPSFISTTPNPTYPGPDRRRRSRSLSTPTSIPPDTVHPQNIPSSAELAHPPPSSPPDYQPSADASIGLQPGLGEERTSWLTSQHLPAGPQAQTPSLQLERHGQSSQQHSQRTESVGIPALGTSNYYPWVQPIPQFMNRPQGSTSPTGPRPFQPFEDYSPFSPPTSAVGPSPSTGLQHSNLQTPLSPYPIHSPSVHIYPYSYNPGAFPMSPFQHPAPYGGHPYPQYGSPPSQSQSMWWYVPQGLPHQFGNQPYYSPHPPLPPPPPLSSLNPHTPPAHPPAEAPYHISSPISPVGSSPAPGAVRTRSFSSPSVPRPPPNEEARLSGVHYGADRPLMRYPFRPNPPTVRSEWVMWVGNVPSDASYDELWQFFHTPPDNSAPQRDPPSVGIMSMFIISRSCCAFVNFETEEQLQSAVARFDGKILRPDEPKSSPLVCRIRRPDDHYKSGVAGQRGTGMHTKWVREKKQGTPGRHDNHARSASESRISSDAVGTMLSDLSEERQGQEVSGSSGSYASTDSSILSKYFPQRYFILKSLMQEDLNISVQKGLWATQRHNEGVLDQAYRTSKDVFLIFSVNQSGEWYGYARMAGPIRRGEPRVAWSTQRPVLPARRSGSGGASSSEPKYAAGRQQQQGRRSSDPNMFFKPGERRLVDQSPQPMSSTEEAKAILTSSADVTSPNSPPVMESPTIESQPPVEVAQVRHSAPAQIGGARADISLQSPPTKHSLDQHLQAIPSQERQAAKEGLRVMIPMLFSGPDAASMPSSTSADMGMTFEGGAGGSGLAYGRRRSVLGAVEEEDVMDQETREEVRRGKMKETSPALISPDQSISRSSSEYSAGFQKPLEDWDESQANQEYEPISPDTWGKSFKVEWLCTRRLPFWRTRYLRNAWNYGREVKICRDGTEVEPGTGMQLLREWDRQPEEHRGLYETKYGETLPLKSEQREGYEAWRSGAFRQPHVRPPTQADQIEPSSTSNQEEPEQGHTSGNDQEEAQEPINPGGQGNTTAGREEESRK